MTHLDFTGKNVVITGASSGLGRALSIAFSRAGANLALLARNQKKLEKTLEALEEGTSCREAFADLSNPLAIKKACQTLTKGLKHVDILINNAAGWTTGKLHELKDEEIHNLVTGTIVGSTLMTKYFLKHLKKASCPLIINVVSTAALPRVKIDPVTSSVPYHAAKWGQAGFSESLRGEVEEAGIRVTTLYPGPFNNLTALDTPHNPEKDLLAVNDVVDAILFCASRPGHASIDSLVINNVQTRSSPYPFA